ncbi:hypothetical protein [Dyella sp.]|uniref:hypothetical protein n=1 Tax=Dyella sp. TaxID=1869338 RepID=UPI002B46B0A2|nr:hypothetical protein [Dyella sp.]HKT27174.1 hypothetical protein [Dyella sp.]
MKNVHSFSCLLGACLLAALAAAPAAFAQQAQRSYPSMAPLSQYLMADQAAEIKLARSAAPAAISDHATVMVLQPHGYVEAVKGSNGYVCIVDRSWMSAFDAPQFWNPKLRGPTCLNPQAAASILPLTLKRTVLALTLHSKEGIQQGMQAAFAARQLPPLEPGAMSYMMSKQGYLDDQAGHWMSHVMFYTPAKMDWGADLAGSPVISNPQFLGDAQPINVQMITVSKWSDGTPAPSM